MFLCLLIYSVVGLLEEESHEHDTRSTAKAKILYNSCIDIGVYDIINIYSIHIYIYIHNLNIYAIY